MRLLPLIALVIYDIPCWVHPSANLAADLLTSLILVLGFPLALHIALLGLSLGVERARDRLGQYVAIV